MKYNHKTRKRQKLVRLIFCVLIGLSGLTLTGGFFPAKAEVSCGDTIGPNDKVTLQADLGPCTGDFALKVIGPATLNLNGHKVTRTVNQKEIGIWVTENNAKVLNGIVMSFKWGFKVDGDGNHLAHNIATNNKKGFTVDGDRNRLDGNTAFNNTNENYQIRGDKNWLADNSAYGGDKECFLIDGGNMNWLLNNVAIVGGSGFVVSTGDEGIGGNYNKIWSCTAIGNADVGILANSGTKGNYIFHNTVSFNGLGEVPGYDVQDANGGCENNYWRKNDFKTSDPNCIKRGVLNRKSTKGYCHLPDRESLGL